FFGRQTLLERSLLLTDALAPRREARWRHVQQDIGTIHPVDMRQHGVKAMGGHVLKPEMLLDTFMKQFHRPAHPVPRHNLACGGPQIIAGQILAATVRSVTLFGTHQLDLPYITNGVSRLQTNKYNSTCWPSCHGHAFPPSWLQACNPARNGGAHDHHGV